MSKGKHKHADAKLADLAVLHVTPVHAPSQVETNLRAEAVAKLRANHKIKEIESMAAKSGLLVLTFNLLALSGGLGAPARAPTASARGPAKAVSNPSKTSVSSSTC